MAEAGSGPTIVGSVELVGQWVDRGLISGVNAADAGYRQLSQNAAQWAAATTQNAGVVGRAFNAVNTGVHRFASASANALGLTNETFLRATRTAGGFFQTLTNGFATMGGVGARGGNNLNQMLGTQMLGLVTLGSQVRSLASSLGQLDLLQASYTRIVGASVGIENATFLASAAMRDATAIAYGYGASIKDVASTMVELARLGHGAQDVLFLTQALAELRLLLASGTGELLSMSKAMGTVVTMMNQFDASIFEAIDGMKLMAEYDIRTATSFDKIQMAMGRFAGAAKTANMTLTETIQVATAATEIGIGGARAGTMLNSVLARIGSNKDALAMLKDLGVSTVTMKDGLLTAASSMDMLLEAYRKLIAGGASTREMAAFAQAFAGLRLQSPMLAMLGVLDKRTRLQVNSTEFKQATTQLQQDLVTVAENANLTLPVGVAPQYDEVAMRNRVKAGVSAMTKAFQDDYKVSQNINMKSLADYVGDWLDVSGPEAKNLIDQYKDLFAGLQSIMDSYSETVESPYARMARDAQAATKELQDERNKAVDMMANTAEVAQARLKTAWEATFMQAGFMEMYKASFESLTEMAIATGTAIMSTFRNAFSIFGAIDVQTGIRAVGVLLETYFGLRVTNMIGNLFATATLGLGRMATQANFLGHALVGAFRSETWGEYLRGPRRFFDEIYAGMNRLNANMADYSQTLQSLGEIQTRPASVPQNANQMMGRATNSLLSGWQGATGIGPDDAQATGLWNALTHVNTELSRLPQGVLTLEQANTALTNIVRGPAEGSGITMLNRDLTAMARILNNQFIDLTRPGSQGGILRGLVNGVEDDIPRLNTVMNQARRIMQSPFASDNMRELANGMFNEARDQIARLVQYSRQAQRVLAETSRGGVVSDEDLNRLRTVRAELRQVTDEIANRATRVQTIWGSVTGYIGTAFNIMSRGISIVSQLMMAWQLFSTAVRGVVRWLGDMDNRLRSIRESMQLSGVFSQSIDKGMQKVKDTFESTSLALTEIQKQLLSIQSTPNRLKIIADFVMENTGLANASSIRGVLASTIDQYGKEMEEALSKGITPTKGFVERFIEELNRQLGANISREQAGKMDTALQKILADFGLDTEKQAAQLRKLADQVGSALEERNNIAREARDFSNAAMLATSEAMSSLRMAMAEYFSISNPGSMLDTLGGVESAWVQVEQATNALEVAADDQKEAAAKNLEAAQRNFEDAIRNNQRLMTLVDAQRGGDVAGMSMEDVIRIAYADLDVAGTVRMNRLLEILQDEGQETLRETFKAVTGLADVTQATALDINIFLTNVLKAARKGTVTVDAAMVALTTFSTALAGSTIPAIGADMLRDTLNPENMQQLAQNVSQLQSLVESAQTKQEEVKQLDLLSVSLQNLKEANEARQQAFQQVLDANIAGIEVQIAQIDGIINAIQDGIAEGKNKEAGEKEIKTLKEEQNKLREEIAGIQQQSKDMLQATLGEMVGSFLDDAILDAVDEKVLAEAQERPQFEEAKAKMEELSKQVTTNLYEWQEAQATYEAETKKEQTEAQKKATADAKAAADKLKEDFFRQLGIMVAAIHETDALLAAEVARVFSEITGVKIDAIGKYNADALSGSNSAKDIESSKPIVDATISATEANAEKMADVQNRLAKAEERIAKLLARERTTTGSGTRGRQTDPVRDAISNIEAEQKQALTDLEIAYRTLTDAEGNIVKYLDRTETVEYANKRVGVYTDSIKAYSKLLASINDPKQFNAIQTKIKQLSLEKVKLQSDIDLTAVRRKIADLEFSTDILSQGADAAASSANFDKAREFYRAAYENRLKVLDEKMSSIDKETLEYQDLANERRTLALEHELQLAKLISDEFEHDAEQDKEMGLPVTARPELAMLGARMYYADELNAQQKMLGVAFKQADAQFQEEFELLKTRIAEARAALEAKAREQGITDEKEIEAYVNTGMADRKDLSVQPLADRLMSNLEESINAMDISVIKPGQRVWDPISEEYIIPTFNNIAKYVNETQAHINEGRARMEAELAAANMSDQERAASKEKINEWVKANLTVMETVRENMQESLGSLNQSIESSIVSGWDEGFNIGLEHGFSAEGFAELQKSMKKNIAQQISQSLQQMLTKEITTVLTDAFQGIMGDQLGSSIGGILGPIFGGLIGSALGFLIGGSFSDMVNQQVEAQLKQQKDSVNAQGFGWSYEESDQATPYYQFAPDVTKESVNIINFRTTFNITTDAAQALMAQRRELERVCTEIFNSMAKAASSTFGPKSAV